MTTKTHRLAIGSKDETTLLIDRLAKAGKNQPVLILGHGAGAGIKHNFFETIVPLIISHGITVVRYNFLYMEKGSKRPDQKSTCFKVISSVLSFCQKEFPSAKIFLAGKSFGGRMSSLFLASHPSPTVSGMIFLGFPLHNPDKVEATRAEHLYEVTCSSLFLQGTRDKLADLPLLQSVLATLPLAKIVVIEGADHSFDVLKKSGIKQERVFVKLAEEIGDFVKKD
jgi:predicted alpha/beta-hydrolase family hydrolase